jgi:hypothetical protein
MTKVKSQLYSICTVVSIATIILQNLKLASLLCDHPNAGTEMKTQEGPGCDNVLQL